MRGVAFKPVRVETGSADEDGRLVFADGKLVAVLVRLSDEHEEPELRGTWFLEVGFGWWLDDRNEVFPTLENAEAWIAQRLDEWGRRARPTHSGLVIQSSH